MTFNQRCKEQGYCTCTTYNCLIYGIRELEAKLARVSGLVEGDIGDLDAVGVRWIRQALKEKDDE